MNHENSALAKHCTIQHNGELQEFRIRIQGIYRTCLERQSAEAVIIEQLSKEADIIINNRSETQLEKVNRNKERVERKDQENENNFDKNKENKKHIEEMIRKRKEKGRGRPRKKETKDKVIPKMVIKVTKEENKELRRSKRKIETC